MGNSSTAKRPAKQDATSPAQLVHQEVNSVVVSFFDDERATIQRRYRRPDGTSGYANSLRPMHWKDAQTALGAMQEWHAKSASADAPSGEK